MSIKDEWIGAGLVNQHTDAEIAKVLALLGTDGETIATILARIGQSNDTGGSATAGTMMGKLNALPSLLPSLRDLCDSGLGDFIDITQVETSIFQMGTLGTDAVTKSFSLTGGKKIIGISVYAPHDSSNIPTSFTLNSIEIDGISYLIGATCSNYSKVLGQPHGCTLLFDRTQGTLIFMEKRSAPSSLFTADINKLALVCKESFAITITAQRENARPFLAVAYEKTGVAE